MKKFKRLDPNKTYIIPGDRLNEVLTIYEEYIEYRKVVKKFIKSYEAQEEQRKIDAVFDEYYRKSEKIVDRLQNLSDTASMIADAPKYPTD